MLPILLALLLRVLVKREKPITAALPHLRVRSLRKPVNLALQGGGAHGAFTWGVLDQLLTDGRIEVDGISGTSAGAVNSHACRWAQPRRTGRGAQAPRR